MRGLLGLKGQSMSGQKQELRLYKIYRYAASRGASGARTGTFTMPVSGALDIYGFGPGGAGGESVGTNATSGGGGAAGKRRIYLPAGGTLAWSVSRSTATTITLPNGDVLSAGPGAAGGAGTGAGGAGGTCSGPWDIARTGGKGGGENPGGVYDEPTAGEYGGDPGTGSMTAGGGGGGAGFTDEPLFPVGGNGGGSGGGVWNGYSPGGGGGANSGGSGPNGSPYYGAPGEVVFAVYAETLI